MLSATHIRVLLFLALICFPSFAAAQRNRPTGQSIIIGRVFFADTNRPVRRATVNLLSNLNHRPVRTTPANQRGEFRFTEVAPGSYFVVATAPGIVSPQTSMVVTEFGISGAAEMDQTRVTLDGKNTVRCEVRAVRGSTIKGTITYVDKEPVVNGRIILYRRKGATITPFFPQNVFTNDRGMYRIDGLPEGEYFVSVVAGTAMGQGTDYRTPPVLPSAYYPSVKSLTEAKAVQVQSGTEITGINFTVGDDVSRRISGVMKWRSGESVTQGGLTIRRKSEPTVELSLSQMFRSFTPPDADRDRDDTMPRDLGLVMMTFPQSTEVSPDGRWEFEDLVPGTYIITAYTQLPDKGSTPTGENPDAEDGPSDFMGGRRAVSRQVEITIEDEDRTDVTIELTEGGRILGSVTMADGSPPPQIAITVEQPNKPDFLMNMPYASKRDGTFLLEGISAGDVRLDVELPGRNDFYLQSITLGDQDLTRQLLQVNEGAEVTGVRITLDNGLASVTGRVQWNDDASIAGGAGVLLVKADRTLWHLRSSRWFATADATGSFALKCPPGNYLVFTWPAGGQPVEGIGDFLRAQAGSARTVSLQSKQEKQLDLTVNRPRK